ncbi:MAG: hypothetical protein ACFFAU_12995 [Candidatus Hodarchaeota archaeon]
MMKKQGKSMAPVVLVSLMPSSILSIVKTNGKKPYRLCESKLNFIVFPQIQGDQMSVLFSIARYLFIK